MILMGTMINHRIFGYTQCLDNLPRGCQTWDGRPLSHEIMEGWLQTFVEILLGTMVSVNWLGPLAPDSQTAALVQTQNTLRVGLSHQIPPSFTG